MGNAQVVPLVSSSETFCGSQTLVVADCPCAQDNDGLAAELECLEQQVRVLKCRRVQTIKRASTQAADWECRLRAKEQKWGVEEACLKEVVDQLEKCSAEMTTSTASRLALLEERKRSLVQGIDRRSKEAQQLRADQQRVRGQIEQMRLQFKARKPPVARTVCAAIADEENCGKAFSEELKLSRMLQRDTLTEVQAEVDELNRRVGEVKRGIVEARLYSDMLRTQAAALRARIADQKKRNESGASPPADTTAPTAVRSSAAAAPSPARTSAPATAEPCTDPCPAPAAEPTADPVTPPVPAPTPDEDQTSSQAKSPVSEKSSGSESDLEVLATNLDAALQKLQRDTAIVAPVYLPLMQTAHQVRGMADALLRKRKRAITQR